MLLPPGSRVTVRWTDGRKYSAFVVGARDGHYAIRFDGAAEATWVPYAHVALEGGLPETSTMAAAAAGARVYDEGAEVMALRNGALEPCMIIEYEPARGLYNVMWNRDNVADHIDPRAIDPTSHHGLYGRNAQEERNNPTLPVGTHVLARRSDGRVLGGTIIANDGESLVCRWDGERARQRLTRTEIVQLGGVAPPPPRRPGEMFVLDPTRPPTQQTRDWYRDGEAVWAQASEDHWWYEATVVSREWVTRPGIAGGDSRYTIEWADGFGRSTSFDAQLRLRTGWLLPIY